MNGFSIMVQNGVPDCFSVDSDFLIDAGNISQALFNLNKLAFHDAEYPDLVRFYVTQAEERLQLLGTMLRSIHGLPLDRN